MKSKTDMADGVDDLLRLAGHPKPRLRTSAEHTRSAARIAKIAATPIAIVLLLAWLKKGGLVSLLGALALGAAVITGGIYFERRLPVPSPPSRALTMGALVNATMEEATRDSLPSEPEATPTSLALAPPRPSASAAIDSPPESEQEMLGRAYAVLGGNPAEALAIVGACAVAFPRGKLGAEREMLTIEALNRLGRRREARTRAEALLQRYPHSIYRERVLRLLDRVP